MAEEQEGLKSTTEVVPGGTDVRTLFDKDFLGSWDLPPGKDVPVTIREVRQGKLVAAGGRKSRKPIVFFEGKEKALVLNATNTNTIVSMYGAKVGEWVGKKIVIYATTTKFGREMKDCIRVRPVKGGA